MLLLLVGNPHMNATRKLGKKVSPFFFGSFNVLLQLRDLTRLQLAQFLLDGRDVLFCLMNLADNPNKLSPDAFTLHGFGRVPELIKDSLESIGIPLTVGLVHLSHQSSTEFPVCLILGKIRMDTLGSFPEETLQVRRWLKIPRLGRLPMSSLVGFLRPFSRFLGTLACGLRRLKRGLNLCDFGFPVIQFCIQYADLPQIAAFKALQQGAKIGQFQFTFRQCGSNGGQFLPFAKKFLFFRRYLSDDLKSHVSGTPVLQLS